MFTQNIDQSCTYIHIVYLKKQQQKRIYVTVLFFYSIFNMSACRKTEMQNDLLKKKTVVKHP